MRTLIVDDEPVARRGLRVLLERLPDVEVVGEARGVSDALQQIEAARPEVVLLDIEMPGGTGFELLAQLEPAQMPAIIFVTAYSEHAIRAFEMEALDYVLKPVNPERLALAIDRARRTLNVQEAAVLNARITRLLLALGDNRLPASDRIPFRVDGSIRLVAAGEIEVVEAAGNYCSVHTRGGQMIIRETLSAVEARLPPVSFVRIHKSMVVAVRSIAEIRPLPNRDAVAVLRSGRTVRVSRQFRERLEQITGAPLG
jgi:two-component system LytT family response regulator